MGPVFAYELLTTSRRWQVYAGRSLFAAGLLAGMVVVYVSWNVGHVGANDFRRLATVGRWFYYAVIGTELGLVLLAAPAATAGAICLDRARGSLTHLLVTDLSDAEIVLGKLGARLIPVVGLIACSLPVLALVSLLGGVDPEALFGATLVALGLAALGTSMAILASVFVAKTHEVLMVVYGVWAAWLLTTPAWAGLRMLGIGVAGPPAWVELSDPFRLAFLPYSRPGSIGLGTFAAFFLICLAVAAALAGLAVLRLRPSLIRSEQGGLSTRVIRVLTATPPGLRSPVAGPTLDDNPVLWREWHRAQPSQTARLVWRIYYAAVVVGNVLVIVSAWPHPGPNLAGIAAWLNGLQVSVGLLLASLYAATSLAEERVRGSLDMLLATPLPTGVIVRGKWWGAFRATLGVAVAPTILAAALALRTGHWPAPFLMPALILAYGAAIASVGLAAATWTRRPGRAVALTVTVYLGVAVAWFFVVASVGPRLETLATASPFFGPGNLAFHASRATAPDWPTCVAATLLWIAVDSVIAGLILLAVQFTFDRALGRTPDDPNIQWHDHVHLRRVGQRSATHRQAPARAGE